MLNKSSLRIFDGEKGFLILHSSWRNVAKREIEIINELKEKS